MNKQRELPHRPDRPRDRPKPSRPGATTYPLRDLQLWMGWYFLTTVRGSATDRSTRIKRISGMRFAYFRAG